MNIPKHETAAAGDEEIIRLLTAFDPPIPAAETLERQPLPWLQGDKPMNPLQRLLARPGLRMAVSLALLIALVGAYAIFDARTVSAGEVLDSARARAGANPGLSYRGVLAATGLGLDGATLTAAVQGAKMRAEVCRPAGNRCHINLHTPGFTWMYDPELGVAERIETPAGLPQTGMVSPLGGGLSMEAMLDEASRQARVELQDDDVVAGRAAYVLSVTPDDATSQRTRFWIDQTYFIILRVETLAPDGQVLSSLGYTAFEINPALDPNLFDFVPPAGTDVTCRRSLNQITQEGGQVLIRREIDPATGQVINEDPEVPCPPFPTQP